MAIDLAVDELTGSEEVKERCPECGHVWEDGDPDHFTWCRYVECEPDAEEELPYRPSRAA